MDCDDVSLPHRLEKQVAFLEQRGNVGICGGWINVCGNGKDHISRHPGDDASIQSSLIFDLTLAHPTVMMSRQMLNAHNLRYDETYTHAQDYDLWTRGAEHTQFSNIQDVLLRYRLHSDSVVAKDAAMQRMMGDRVRMNQLRRLEIQPTEAEFALHHALSTRRLHPESNYLNATGAWLERLIRANNAWKIYPIEAFHKAVAEKWFYACNAAARLGLGSWLKFRRSGINDQGGISRLREVRLLAKCLYLLRSRQVGTRFC